MNILFITADQWRGECLSALNHPVVKTPNLDLLASQSVLFKRHYAQTAPCGPSRTSLHTGMYLHNHRCVENGTPVDNRFTNWAKEVCKKGYSTSLFGYSDTAPDPREYEENDIRLTQYCEPLPGIESFTPYWNEVSTDWVNFLENKGYSIPDRHWNLYGDKVEGIDWKDGGEKILPLAITAEDHETHFMVDKCIEWINGQNQPWVTHLSLLRPHPPFSAPEPYNGLYDPAAMTLPVRQSTSEIESKQHPFLEYCLDNTHYRSATPKLGESAVDLEIQQAKATYYGLMAEVDDNLGRLIEQLKANGSWDSTLIVFTSDHGEQLGDHWLTSKVGYFDQSYHIPLIIHDPRKTADASRGMQIDCFTENVDIMPTMLDWLGCDIPAQCDGHSLMPIVLSGQVPQSWRKEAHWEYDFRTVLDDSVERHLGLTAHQCSLNVIRDKRYKYVHFTALPPLFFDLEEDPNEFVNLAGRLEYQPLVLEYAQKMLSWRMNHTERGLTETYLSDNGPVTRRSALRL
jgi:arylsulfatase A-like enzyme